jgi:hypothetical protein
MRSWMLLAVLFAADLVAGFQAIFSIPCRPTITICTPGPSCSRCRLNLLHLSSSSGNEYDTNSFSVTITKNEEVDDERLLQTYKREQLADLCKEMNLATSGTKKDLLKRLRDAATQASESLGPKSGTETVSETELMNDDVLLQIVEREPGDEFVSRRDKRRYARETS